MVPQVASMQAWLHQMRAHHAQVEGQKPRPAPDPQLELLLLQMKQRHAFIMGQPPVPPVSMPVAGAHLHSPLAGMLQHDCYAVCNEPSSMTTSFQARGCAVPPAPMTSVESGYPVPAVAVAAHLEESEDLERAEGDLQRQRNELPKHLKKTRKEARASRKCGSAGAASGGSANTACASADAAALPPSDAAAPGEAGAPARQAPEVAVASGPGAGVLAGDSGPSALGGGLNVMEDLAWLAEELGMSAESKAPGVPAVLVDLAKFWTTLWADLPEPNFGCGPHTQHFGLLFGLRGDGGVLRLTQERSTVYLDLIGGCTADGRSPAP